MGNIVSVLIFNYLNTRELFSTEAHFDTKAQGRDDKITRKAEQLQKAYLHPFEKYEDEEKQAKLEMYLSKIYFEKTPSVRKDVSGMSLRY